MSWSPGMQRWMRDAEQHGIGLYLYKSKRLSRFAGGRNTASAPPHVIPDEALLQENVDEIFTESLDNILLTDGFINTETPNPTDPITTEGGGSLII